MQIRSIYCAPRGPCSFYAACCGPKPRNITWLRDKPGLQHVSPSTTAVAASNRCCRCCCCGIRTRIQGRQLSFPPDTKTTNCCANKRCAQHPAAAIPPSALLEAYKPPCAQPLPRYGKILPATAVLLQARMHQQSRTP